MAIRVALMKGRLLAPEQVGLQQVDSSQALGEFQITLKGVPILWAPISWLDFSTPRNGTLVTALCCILDELWEKSRRQCHRILELLKGSLTPGPGPIW